MDISGAPPVPNEPPWPETWACYCTFLCVWVWVCVWSAHCVRERACAKMLSAVMISSGSLWLLFLIICMFVLFILYSIVQKIGVGKFFWQLFFNNDAFNLSKRLKWSWSMEACLLYQLLLLISQFRLFFSQFLEKSQNCEICFLAISVLH